MSNRRASNRRASLKQPYLDCDRRLSIITPNLNGDGASASTSTDSTKSPASASDVDADGCISRWRHTFDYLMYMIVGVDLLIVLALASIITFSVDRLGSEEWLSYITASQPAVGILGAFYSFALVFRTNTCYSRWWEGRVLWGSMIVCTIRIAQQAHLWIKEPALVRRVSCLAVMYAYCCKAQLNGAGVEDDTQEGTKLLQKGVVSQEELDMISRQSGWQSFYCIDEMRATISSGLEADSMQDQWKNNAAQTAMEETMGKLDAGIGGCLRVKSTSLPVAYDIILNTAGCIFFVVGCLAWAPAAKYYNPILVLIVYIIVKMITRVGTYMEDPFGDDESDLPLGKFCEEIHKQITAIDERAKFKLATRTDDIERGPADL
mmetsp:Transcript_24232/g.34666  ORF Transcript_24232/g.34666 Transcript_24232/m.34666 type:complete len:377 (-) Transcript_24232:170-1300(-)